MREIRMMSLCYFLNKISLYKKLSIFSAFMITSKAHAIVPNKTLVYCSELIRQGLTRIEQRAALNIPQAQRRFTIGSSILSVVQQSRYRLLLSVGKSPQTDVYTLLFSGAG